MKKRLLLAALFLWAGCVPLLGNPLSPVSDSGRAWQALLDGKTESAEADLKAALSTPGPDSEPAFALFGAAALAYEQGRSVQALQYTLDLLELAGADGREPRATLATAAAGRLARLLTEIPDRREAEERILTLPRAQLPWQTQYLLAMLTDSVARRRADAPMLERESQRAGCLANLRTDGVAGRLPYLELEAEKIERDATSPAPRRSGCRFEVVTASRRGGVRVLRADIEVEPGTYDLVIDYAGPALTRVDGGPWHHHGDNPDKYGPLWSASHHSVKAGHHEIEIRLGMAGSSAGLGLMLARSESNDVHRRDSDLESAVLDLAQAQASGLTGDVDEGLAALARLTTRSHFSVGIATAARLTAADPTRPATVTRAASRALSSRAVALAPSLARAWLDLSTSDLENDRPREAAENAERALRASPAWIPAELALASALAAQGVERDADAALDRARRAVTDGNGACAVIERALDRAEDLEKVTDAERLVALLARCDAQSESTVAWYRKRGNLAAAEAALRRIVPTAIEPAWTRSELASVLLAAGRPGEAIIELQDALKAEPRDTSLRLHLVDALTAAGAPDDARALLAETQSRFPARSDVRRVAEAAGLPGPLQDFRVDGSAVVEQFRKSGRQYHAPAVVILDRTVERVFPDGARAQINHSITLVLSKEGIERAGEIHVPEGAEVLSLRTRKTDGTIREAEEIAGKPTISAPDLAPGDFVESEILEYKEPPDAFAPGFIGERFYFQSFDAPLDRSEYVLVVPKDLQVDQDRRAGAPASSTMDGPQGTRVLHFVAQQMPQLFAERGSELPTQWVPSVRVSSGASLAQWSRYLSDRLFTVARTSPELRQVAHTIEGDAGKTGLASALVDWVNAHIEPEDGVLESATSTVARGRGNRAAVFLALARVLNLKADLCFARPVSKNPPDEPVVPQELDDFSETLVRLAASDGRFHFVDPRLRHAPLGYVPPGLAASPAFAVGAATLDKVTADVPDSRQVSIVGQLNADGSGRATVTEDLTGWPQLEWADLMDRAGSDRVKLRQEFEQRWLGQHFPGATLDELDVQPSGDRASVRYTFSSPRLAVREGRMLRLRPTFFAAQPGRRYVGLPQRRTVLIMGPEIPLSLTAEFKLPPGSTVVDAGEGGAINVAGEGGEARFSEERAVKLAGPAGGSHLQMSRHWQLPIMRVAPGHYDELAKQLRRVDPIELGEIRIEVPGDLTPAGR